MALISANDSVVFIKALESELSSIPILNGQIIFVKDHKSLLWDVDNLRIELTQAIILDKESNRTSLLAPLPNKFYYVVETNVLYYYGSDWVVINGGGSGGGSEWPADFTNATTTKTASGSNPSYTTVTDTYTLVSQKVNSTSWRETLTMKESGKTYVRTSTKAGSTWTSTIVES